MEAHDVDAESAQVRGGARRDLVAWEAGRRGTVDAEEADPRPGTLAVDEVPTARPDEPAPSGWRVVESAEIDEAVWRAHPTCGEREPVLRIVCVVDGSRW